jgi:dTDP-4-amino-4,6-dideoxygalactose transaminase
MMRIPLVDLHKQVQSIKPEVLAKVEELLDSTSFIMGNTVSQLEESLGSKIGTGHAISCNSGTDALLLIMEAMGIGQGDEVITTPFTFFATADTISRTGAVPVFVDVDQDTFNMDTTQIEAAITAKTKAILPVHIFGQPADMEPIIRIAKRHQLKVIEDACQAIGATYTMPDGSVHQTGSIGHAAAFSFYPTKNLGAYGDGGMITTNDASLAQIIKALRAHGGGNNGKAAYEIISGETVDLGIDASQADATVYDPTKYYNFLIGMNSRLDAIQAGILEVKMNYIDKWNEARQLLAARYDSLLAQAGLAERLSSQKVLSHVQSVWHLYVVKCLERESLCSYLAKEGIATGVYYPVPLHLQKVYQFGQYKLGYKEGDLPVSEALSRQTMALPLFPELTATQQEYIVDKIKDFYQGK